MQIRHLSLSKQHAQLPMLHAQQAEHASSMQALRTVNSRNKVQDVQVTGQVWSGIHLHCVKLVQSEGCHWALRV
ncbi:hypothetical protein DUNSADRAFT_4174 [Dunaliella salina]|uniref:Encoded protein n=1 Tax=Dunaliella salina TaxID=3046 RepID=A0ABQ7GSM9_DUNSA|nr:hypothetical protein DUNSADRAFT_4174 [Dunaliella salina]|eukprot:KAF5837603.1 hypothetical protein DUNSADRAFT_4174 [Dunaliella salina]